MSASSTRRPRPRLSVCWLDELAVEGRYLVPIHPNARVGCCIFCGDVLDELDRERVEAVA